MTETQFANIIENITGKNENLQFGFTEPSIMSMIFRNSAAADAATANAANAAYFYISEDRRGDPLQNHLKFYDRYMQRIQSLNAITSSTKNVMDFDISTMLTQDAIKCLFFLDLLSEIYYNHQNNKSTLKCRYFIDEGKWRLWTRSDFYTINIEYSVTNGVYNISSVNVDKDKERMLLDVKSMFALFGSEISRHIKYLGKKDIQQGQQAYLSNIQGFYKFCRIKMMYYALKELPETPSRDIARFIDTQLIYIFMNLKNDIAIKNPGYQNVSTTSRLLMTKKKLNAINYETMKTKELMRRNEMQSKKIKDSYNRQLLYVCSALTFIFILTTLLLLNVDTSIQEIPFIIILITVCVYITMYYILYTANPDKEYFETFDKIFQFPLEPATANAYTYGNDRLGKQVRIFGSTKNARNDYWQAFDRKNGTLWESANNSYAKGDAKFIYRNRPDDTYAGELLQIDLMENVILQYFALGFSESNKAPGNFRIYGSTRSDIAANTAPVDITDSSWQPIFEVKAAKYPGMAQRRFDIKQSQFDQYLYPQQVSAGRNFSVFVDNKNEAQTFGLNSEGQLGIGHEIKQFYPQLVILQPNISLKNVIQVSAGGFHTLFLTREGFAYSCGNNQWGQLGDSTTTARSSPVDVRSGNSKLTNIVQVCAGHVHSAFLLVNKTVVACGRNLNGQLGNGTTVDSSLPISKVINKETNSQLSNVIQISAGVYSFATFFLLSNGAVYKCGVYSDPTIEASGSVTKAEKISNSDDITVKIASAGGFCLCVTDTNVVWGVGQNKFNQLGDRDYNSSTTIQNLPKYVHTYADAADRSKQNTAQVIPSSASKVMLSDIIDVAAGTSHSIFLKSDRSVLVCGKNNFGQLGINTTNNIQYPMEVSGLNNALQIAGGDNHSLFLINNTSNTILKSCGFNADGQIGAVPNPSTDRRWTSATEECYSCLNPQESARFATFLTKSPVNVTTNAGAAVSGPTPSAQNTVTTFIDNYEKTLYTNNIQKPYRHYAIIVNKLAANVDAADKCQISEWKLFGTYANQTSYLTSEYTALYTSKTQELINKKNEYEQQNRLTQGALSSAIQRETAAYGQWQALVAELAKPEYNTDGMVIPPGMDTAYYQKNLNDIKSKIDTRRLDAAALNLRIASSNTESMRLNGITTTLNTQNTQLEIDVNQLSGHYASFQSYKTVIDSMQSTLSAATIGNNGILTEQQKSVLQSRIDETNAAIRLGAAQVQKSSMQVTLRAKENTVFEQANELANAKLEADRQSTILQNEISTRQTILTNISLVTAADADIQAEEIKRLQAQREVVVAKSITEGAEQMAQARMAVADNAKKLSDNLQEILSQKTEDVKQLQQRTDQMLSELEDLDDRIARIEGDTSAYVERINKDTMLLEARRAREKKWLEYQISKLQTTYAEVDSNVKSKIAEYEQSMREDQDKIDELMSEIKIKGDEIAEIVIERQKYKYIAKAVDVDASVVTIQTKILYNINNTATVIANSIVLTGMDKEYNQIAGQKEQVKVLEAKSDNLLEINKRDDKIIYSTNKLLLNIMLLAVILIVLYHKYVSIYVLILMIIAFAILIAVYFMEVLHIVRTYGDQKYWQTGLPKFDDK